MFFWFWASSRIPPNSEEKFKKINKNYPIKQSYRADADGTAWQKVKTSVRFGGAPGNKEVVNPLTANAGIPAEAEEPKLREKKKDKHTLKDLGKDVEMTATGVSRTLENL